jgi:carboxymethylenebutenolidase
MGDMIKFDRPDGDSVPAYFAAPPKNKIEKAPGLIVLQEWWGLNAQIKRTADRFANAGFRTVVPDLYRGKVTQDAGEANHLMTELDFESARTDVAAAVEHLKEGGNKKVGVLGFCMGGALTLMSASSIKEIGASVCFYGIPPDDKADLTRIDAPLMCHFASDDDWCTPQAITALEKKLKAGNVPYTLFRYEETEHGFFNEDRPEVYDEVAAKESFERSLHFLKKNLA